MAEKPAPAQIHSAVEEFSSLANQMIENIERWWMSWECIVHNCPESLVLSQKPGTVMPNGIQTLLDKVRRRSSWNQVNQKIKNNPDLQAALKTWKKIYQERPAESAKLIAMAKYISKAIIVHGWGGESAVDPFLDLERHDIDRLAVDEQKAIYQSARKQAIKFDLYIQATANEPSPADLCLVDLDQAAALVNRSKRTLERLQADPTKNMPLPFIQGGGGKKSEWKYSELKLWLEKEFTRKLPDTPPHIIR